MSCKCPHCLREIPAGTQAEIVAAHTSTRLFPCEGPVEGGGICAELLTSRQRNRPCPKCGFNNWKEAQRDAAAREVANGSAHTGR